MSELDEQITCVCGKLMTRENSTLAPELFLCDECARREAPVDAMQGWASAITDLKSAAEICRNVEKQRDALRATLEALSAPVSDAEWRNQFGFSVVNVMGSPLPRGAVNSIIAARAKGTPTGTREAKIPEDLQSRYKVAKAQLGLLPARGEQEDDCEGTRFNCEEVIEFIERIARLEAELAKEKERRMKTDLAFVLSDAILPSEFEPTLPPTIRLHRFIEKQQKQIQTLRVALQTLVDQGEPERGDGELWSSWQVRVKARLAAIETLAQTEG